MFPSCLAPHHCSLLLRSSARSSHKSPGLSGQSQDEYSLNPSQRGRNQGQRCPRTCCLSVAAPGHIKNTPVSMLSCCQTQGIMSTMQPSATSEEYLGAGGHNPLVPSQSPHHPALFDNACNGINRTNTFTLCCHCPTTICPQRKDIITQTQLSHNAMSCIAACHSHPVETALCLLVGPMLICQLPGERMGPTARGCCPSGTLSPSHPYLPPYRHNI